MDISLPDGSRVGPRFRLNISFCSGEEHGSAVRDRLLSVESSVPPWWEEAYNVVMSASYSFTEPRVHGSTSARSKPWCISRHLVPHDAFLFLKDHRYAPLLHEIAYSIFCYLSQQEEWRKTDGTLISSVRDRLDALCTSSSERTQLQKQSARPLGHFQTKRLARDVILDDGYVSRDRQQMAH